MKGALVLIVYLFLSSSLCGQTEGFFCCTDGFWNSILEANPLFRTQESLLEHQYHFNISKGISSRGGVITLPVVVHIIHDNGLENISDARVQAMINDLNDAFRNRASYHIDIGVDFGIEFCLAQRDTQGLATTGIIRHNSIYTDMSIPSAASQINKIATWDPKQYINIRLVREVCTGESCEAAGYASMPPAHGVYFDGMVFEAKYAGSNHDNSSVIIHEMGHYLGLDHTFKGGCLNNDCLADGDHVCDTPPDNMTGSYPCDAQYNTCHSDEDDSSINNPFRSIALGGLGDQPDMIQNYMDYSAYMCYDRFTLGQKERVLFLLNSARSSLLTSKGCLQPCPDQPIAFFNISATTINAGETVMLENSSQFATSYSWYINGVPSGHNTDTSFQFTAPGKYTVNLVAENGLPECSSSSYQMEIEVVCQVQAVMSYEILGSQLFVSHQSVFSDSVEWRIEDGAGLLLFSSDQDIDTFDLSGQNYIRVCLTAFNDYCFFKKCEYISLTSAGIEICNNQIDDDGDGLVDLFDPDCPCSDSSFQAVCEQPCQLLLDSFPDLSMKIKWQSEIYTDDSNLLPNIVIGNADPNDNNIEVITRKCRGDFILNNVENNILIFDGKTGITKREFVANPRKNYYDYAHLTIGDIDRDGSSEIFCKDWDTISCFNINGSLRWVSDKLNMGRGFLLELADFNGDGMAEIYSGNNIVNTENGKLLINSPLSAGCNIINGAQFTTCSANHSIAADLLPAPGLELAAGNIVYEVSISNLNGTTGNDLNPVIADLPVLDGYTSVADIDGDGELDVVVVRDISFPDGGGIWVWNPRTRALIASASSGPSGGVPFIGDVDGDCFPEIGMTFEKQLRMYKFDGSSTLQLLYNLPTTDDSGFTGITMFDFNQDGKNELVYRDETQLRIIEGATGITLAAYLIKSGTGLEYPLIADVDRDGEADIIVNGYLSDPKEHRVFCLESAGSRWAPARSVWNQPGYNVTNVNDDLTIPRYPQNPAKPLTGNENCLLSNCATPYNAFNVQATYRTQAGCVQFPAHDLTISLLSYSCNPDSISLCFTIENTASLAIRDENIPFSIWGRNPFFYNSSLLYSFAHHLDLDPNAKDTICYSFPIVVSLDSFYLIANDNGMTPTPYSHPASSLSECRYDNNIGKFHLDLAWRHLDLGPDITKCESEVITLTAGSDFVSYSWSDNSTDSIYSSGFPGQHFVETKDQCGRIYSDTVFFKIDTIEKLNLGLDTILCSDQSLSYTLQNSYDWINWIPASIVNCNTCSTVAITSDTSFSLIAVAANGNCFTADTVAITIKQPFKVDTILRTCFGDTLIFHNVELASAGHFEIKIEPCDTIYSVDVENYLRDSVVLSMQICSNDSIWFNGGWHHSSGIFGEQNFNMYGCDSIVSLDLTIIEPIVESETISVCSGDSVFVLNQWVHVNKTLSDTLTSARGCDSILIFEVIFNPNIIQNDSFTLCMGDSVFLNGKWILSPGTYIDTITNTPCDIVQINNVYVLPEVFNIEKIDLCPGDSILLINHWISSPGTVEDTLQSFFGCDSINQFIVDVVPDPGQPSLSVDCDSGFVTLSISPGPPWNILWSNGDTTYQTSFITSGSASLILSADPSCIIEFPIDIPEIPSFNDLPGLKDTIIDENQTLKLNLPLNTNEWHVSWFPPDLFSCDTCPTTTITPKQNVQITVNFTHEDGCEYADSFFIHIKDKDSNLYIPNVFTPNGDGVNDTWHIFYNQDIGYLESIEVFDRWGNMVYRSTDPGNSNWNGIYHGQLLSQGVYAYKVFFKPKDGQLKMISGDITLIR